MVESEQKYSQEQYEILNRCNAKQDMSEWNHWRKENPQEAVLLKEASLWRAYLKGVDLEGAKLNRANLEGANLEGAKLQNAVLWEANLKGANLRETCLQEANFMRTELQGAEFGGAKLQGADFSRAIVDGKTLIWRCDIDRNTKFEGVGLDSMRIYPKIKQLLEYNIRRMNWEEWYPKHIFLRWPIRWFWSVSNYGLSTWRIITWFLMLSLFFAAVYSNISCWYPEGIISNLTVEPHLPLWHYFILCTLRPIYFSVVTMTTLGFGDMYANAQSILGHLLLTIQVILGYVLLGTLVTRFAVLFTAGGPAGEFTEKEKKASKTISNSG